MNLKVSNDEAALSTMASLCLYAQAIALKSMLQVIEEGNMDEAYRREMGHVIEKFFERSVTLLDEVGYTKQEIVSLLEGAKEKTMTIMAEMLMKDLMDEMEGLDNEEE